MTATTTKPTLPDFFHEHASEYPALVRWAFDKVKLLTPDTLEVEGRKVHVRTWVYEGKQPRRHNRFFQQYDAPELASQFTVSQTPRGGEYRGQKQTVLICFTEYLAADGLPLPL